MGRGGAWRQEELKRFSSWVTTKVGLSQRAVGPQPGGGEGAGTRPAPTSGGSISLPLPPPWSLLQTQSWESLLGLCEAMSSPKKTVSEELGII